MLSLVSTAGAAGALLAGSASATSLRPAPAPRAAVRLAADPALVADVANACLAAAGTCTPEVSPFEPHLLSGMGTLGSDMVWSFGVAGFGLAGAYLTQGAEAVSFDDSESESEWFSDDAEPRRRSRALRPPSEDDAWIKDDPFIDDPF